jgi:hypothetical protein
VSIETAELHGFINGAICAGFVIAAAFFLSFWRRTRDGLFLAFSAAFLLMGLAQPLPTLLGLPSEQQAPIYLVRLVAFGLIICAILGKNMQGGRR